LDVFVLFTKQSSSTLGYLKTSSNALNRLGERLNVLGVRTEVLDPLANIANGVG
jgi:hypothetical protein